MAHRRKRLPLEELAEIMASLQALPIAIEPQDPEALRDLWQLALKHQLTVYDAAYLELALRLALPIATRDAALKRAMLACDVKIAQP